MDKWLIDVSRELAIAKKESHPARVRTASRRIAGVALKQFYKLDENDFIKILQSAAIDLNIPDEARLAAMRLQARVDKNFKSISVDPIGDAMEIVRFVKLSNE